MTRQMILGLYHHGAHKLSGKIHFFVLQFVRSLMYTALPADLFGVIGNFTRFTR